MSDIKMIIDQHTGEKRYYDFAPKNTSFLQTAMELKSVGIKNYYFMLEVKNPFSGVADIDPFKSNITRPEIEALMLEMRQNMWFYARTVSRVRSDAGIVPFCLHRGLAAAMWCFERHFDSCLCEPRQTYKTTGILTAPISWAFQIGSENTHIKFFGKETKNTKKNLSDLKDDIDLLPEWLQFKRYIDVSEGKVKKARRATETLENSQFHNKVTINPKASSESHAEGLARGESGAIWYFDEIEYMLYFPVILANSSPAFMTASENARRAGFPTARIFTTTPGNLDSRAGKEAYPVVKSMIPWTEKIYDMPPEQLESYIATFRAEYHADENNHNAREVVRIFYIEYQYYQLRKTHAWVEEQYARSGDKLAIRREILLQRLRGSTDNPIDPGDIEFLIQNMKKSTDDILLAGKWRMLLYPHGLTGQRNLVGPGILNHFDNTIPYILSIDPASGGGGDNTAITVLNPFNLQVAAEFKSPYISQTEILKILLDLVKNYIPKAVIFPEKNAMGIYLIQAICETPLRENLYWSKSGKELEEMTIDGPDAELKKLSLQYKKYGIYTDKKKRDAMFELLFKHIREAKYLLCTEYLVDDICKLVKTSTGKIAAANGEHDDCLMSYLINIYLYYTGDNLEFFGIDKRLHPVLVDPEISSAIEEADDTVTMVKGLGTNTISFETIQRDSAVEVEQLIRQAVSCPSRHFISEEYGDGSTLTDREESLPPSFFDQLNGY